MKSTDLLKLRSALRIPDAAHRILTKAFTDIKSKDVTRQWALPPTNIADEVAHYTSRHKVHKLKSLYPSLRNKLDFDTVEKLALQIDGGLDLLSLAEVAAPLVKPILLYYTSAQLLSVYARAFFDWKRDSRDHGVKVKHDSKTLANTEITISSNGHFPRVVIANFLFTGIPNYFNELVCYSRPPQAHTASGELLEFFGKNELGSAQTTFTLESLLQMDYVAESENLKNRFHFFKWRHSLVSTIFVFDLLLIFVASTIARYNIYGWRQILDGKGNSYKLNFDAAFERFFNFGVDYVLYSLYAPGIDWSATPLMLRENPYIDYETAKKETESIFR